ncbi:hypothetical protein GCM10009744_37120 [Kribbella alba]|uniref:Uncharacterized protein n=1 Tax=Kribbella alba TaxID=190197 RepID=A0ABN2FFJ2_9ACTN
MTTRSNDPLESAVTDDRETALNRSDNGDVDRPDDRDRAGDLDRPDDNGRSSDADRSMEGDRTMDADQSTGSTDTDRSMEMDRSTDDGSLDRSTGHATGTATTATTTDADPLVPGEAAVDFKARWVVIQQGFVDDPRTAVTDADRLVGDVLQRLSTTFDEQHTGLERQWNDGEPSTEDLRSALQRYRAFFERLLTL